MKDVKKCYPLQIVEYDHKIRISQEPEFAWLVPHVMQKRNQII